MDEPTAALTGVEAERLFEVLREIRASGRSVLYVSHRIDEVMRLCDRVTVLRDGAVIATKAIGETSQNEIIRMMIGRQLNEAYPRALAPVAEDVAFAVRDLKSARLDRISFHLRKGEIVGVAGLSGSGQGHLLRLIVGADKASEGRIQVGGRDGRPYGVAAAWKKGLAYVPRERRSEGLVLSRARSSKTSRCHISNRFSRAGAFLSRRGERAIADERGAEVRLKAREYQSALLRTFRRQPAEGRLRKGALRRAGCPFAR